MLFMVTNRVGKDGKYGDEERPNNDLVYQYAYNNKKRGEDMFLKSEGIKKKGFEVALLKELQRLKKKYGVTPKVGIYIHGFNNNYQETIDEIYDLEKSLEEPNGYPPVIVGFSWPSTGNKAYYLSDREEVRDSIGSFTTFLRDMNDFVVKNRQDCISTTFCIVHSMGNYLFRKGMEYLSDHLGSPLGRMLFDETIMIAPDLSSKDIEIDGKGRYIASFSRRVHVYYSKHDRTLKLSSIKRFGGNRLGRHGANNYEFIPHNIVVVDASKHANSKSIAGALDRTDKQVSVHSSYRYHKDILKDIVQVMSSIDRDHIRGREAYTEDGKPMSNHYRLI